MGMFYKHLLSVIPIEGTLPVADGECFGYVDVPQTLRRRGADDVDLLIFVAGFDSVGGSTICSRNSGILAAASSCSLDQHDRPITGFINFCLDEIKVNQLGSIFESDINNLIAVGIHEFAHVLGFNGESWKFFRHPLSGEPLTKRPFRKQLYTCVNGETYRDIIVPSCHTLNEGIAANGMPYFELVTPTVRQVVRNQFGCQSLNGARLENQPTNEFDCFGTHWEERYYYSETLSAYYAPEANYFSALTLAVLEDSGWYRANYTNAKTSPFGHGAGCDFVEKKCIDRNKVPSYGEGFFCDNPIEQYRNGDFKIEYTCDPSHKLKAGCDLMRKMRDPPLPKEGQYFTDPFLGIFAFDSADYCPIAQIDTRDCRNSINNQRIKLSPGETYGPDSLCYDAAINNFGSTTRSKTSLCLESKCNPNTQHLEVYVHGQTLICQFSFQRIGFIYMGKEIRLTCPRLMAACPDLFCPANCAGRGICNYNAEFPVCECFDQEDNSSNCEHSPMLVPNMTEDVCTASSLRVPVLPFDWDWDWNWSWDGTGRRIIMIITTFGIPLLTTMGLLICNI